MMPGRPQSDDSIGALFVQLKQDARVFVDARIALYRVRLSGWAGQARIIAILGIAALALAHVAIITLFVGLVLTLAPRVGPGWATLIVVASTLAVAGLLGWLAYRRIGAMGAGKATP